MEISVPFSDRVWDPVRRTSLQSNIVTVMCPSDSMTSGTSQLPGTWFVGPFSCHCRSRLKLSFLFPMANPPKTPTSRAILNAVRASLRLMNSSSELLTVSQLLAIRRELEVASAVVTGQLQALQFGSFVCFVEHTRRTPQLTPIPQEMRR